MICEDDCLGCTPPDVQAMAIVARARLVVAEICAETAAVADARIRKARKIADELRRLADSSRELQNGYRAVPDGMPFTKLRRLKSRAHPSRASVLRWRHGACGSAGTATARTMRGPAYACGMWTRGWTRTASTTALTAGHSSDAHHRLTTRLRASLQELAVAPYSVLRLVAAQVLLWERFLAC